MAPALPRTSCFFAWFTRFAPLFVVLLVVLVYAPSLRVPFLFDDADAVLRNPTIRRLDGAVLHPPADGSTTTGRPVVNISYALNYALSGEEVWSYHVLNVLIHALAALALLGLMRRTLVALDPSALRFQPALAGLVALLWALHPLQTETVICIAQRTEALGGLFYLVTLYAFARALADPNNVSRGWLLLSVAACLIGMASKEVMVTAPVLVLLYDRTFFSRSFAAAWRERRVFYFALAATWLLLIGLVLQNGGSRGVAAGFGLGLSSWSYLLKQAEGIVHYLRLSAWPHPLVLDYGTAVPASLAEVWWQGGVVLALLGPVTPNVGQSYIVPAFLVVILGGLGSLVGTLIAAVLAGLVSALSQIFVDVSSSQVLMLLFVVLFLQFRPQGVIAVRSRALDG
ncbi:MAG: hypothetical protein WCQ44_02395 [Opitutaceae bacterium]